MLTVNAPATTDATQVLFGTVVQNDYCIGCGACSIINDNIKVELDSFGKFKAALKNVSEVNISDTPVTAVCPFSDQSVNEDVIGQELYGDLDIGYDTKIGYFDGIYAGHVEEGEFRKNGSSGGMGTWILSELFRLGLIDGVVHVKSNNHNEHDPLLFRYQISRSLNEITSGAKSRYYPVEMSEVLKTIKENPGRYAVIGVSCFIKSVRLLARQDPEINERVKYCIGLICGHEKSTRFAEMLAWQVGIEPGKISTIDFRKKLEGRVANDYAVEVVGTVEGREVTVTKRMHELMGFNWGHGFFKPKSCDYCDDVMNETADLTIGDAWLPQYVQDSKGTNVLVVRHPVIKEIIEEGIESSKLSLDIISAESVAKSQSSNYRHRRDELPFRLQVAKDAGAWAPKKRVVPSSDNIAKNRKSLQLTRMELAQKTHSSFAEARKMGSLPYFKFLMKPYLNKYDVHYFNKPLWKIHLMKSSWKLKQIAKKGLKMLNVEVKRNRA